MVSPDQYAVGMYERINALWQERRHEIFEGACGFSLISGPPVLNPPLMIVGANPGFGANDYEPKVEITWPNHSYIPTADWDLARRLRKIFGAGDRQGLLEGAIQTNFQFFKSSSIKKPSRYRWFDLPALLRRDLDAACIEELSGYVNATSPAAILVLGLDVFDTHATDATTVLRDRANKRRLLVRGEVFHTPAWGVLHPTGAQVADEDWLRVRQVMEAAYS